MTNEQLVALVLKLQQYVQKKKSKEVTQDTKTSYSSYRNAVQNQLQFWIFQDRKPLENIQGIELFVTICKTAWRTYIHTYLKPPYVIA